MGASDASGWSRVLRTISVGVTGSPERRYSPPPGLPYHHCRGRNIVKVETGKKSGLECAGGNQNDLVAGDTEAPQLAGIVTEIPVLRVR